MRSKPLVVFCAIAIATVILFAVATPHAQNFGMAVGTNAVKIAPARGLAGALAPGARLELPGIQNVVYGITASGTTSVGAVELP